MATTKTVKKVKPTAETDPDSPEVEVVPVQATVVISEEPDADDEENEIFEEDEESAAIVPSRKLYPADKNERGLFLVGTKNADLHLNSKFSEKAHNIIRFLHEIREGMTPDMSILWYIECALGRDAYIEFVNYEDLTRTEMQNVATLVFNSILGGVDPKGN